MTKTLALIAALGLLSAPAFAVEEVKKDAAAKTVATTDAAKTDAKDAKKDEAAATAADKTAPAAGKTEEKAKTEEKKM
jgi:hypothetical protein